MNDSDQQKPSSGSGDAQLRFPLPTGTRVDHYVIREVLGAGGFGITYLAEHEALGKQYAIKEYFPHAFSYRQGRTVRATSSGDSTYKWGLERFITEARALARFKHPAIVDVTSIFEANGTAYIVLAYESGVDMLQWLKNLGHPATQDELDRLVTPLLSALEEVHRHNMMHRDISPDNVLIRQDGRPVLIDFGSARESVRGRARAMSAIVKHGYSPPEQYTSRPDLQGPWTDIYAFAATLYRAISGKLPPDATERIVRDDVQPLATQARAAYRPGFLEAIDRGLRMKVEERPQTIVEWREQLFRPEPLKQPPKPALERAASAPPSAPPGAGVAAKATRGSERVAPVPRPASQRVGASSPAPKPGPTRSPGPPATPDASKRPGTSEPRAHSARISSGSSMRKSERPDLSWLDQNEEALLPDDAAPAAPRASTGQIVTYAILGLLGGAVLGGLLSIVLASIVSTTCFGDQCIYRYLAVCSGIGAVVGTLVGWKLGQQAAEAAVVAEINSKPKF